MSELEAFLRDPVPTREQVARRIERALAGPMRPDEIWLAEQIVRAERQKGDRASLMGREGGPG